MKHTGEELLAVTGIWDLPHVRKYAADPEQWEKWNRSGGKYPLNVVVKDRGGQPRFATIRRVG